ncbi:MAG: metal ABC transporter ATP-binding protein [Chloroflexota bacterium]|nr:metal ABC transporter ATP-binding protein [Chloroflexota bacterium]
MSARCKVIRLEDVWAGYDGEIVLEGINMSIEEQDFVGIIGPNGGGKTTLLRVMLGLIQHTRGRVRILGQSIARGRRFIGYVPQQVGFDRDFPVNVWDVAMMGRLGQRGLLRRYTSEDRRVVTRVLQQVDMLDLRNRPIGELSTGQRQRVYIARALATEPKILFLDEPTASVDAHVTTSIYELLQRLNEHITILLVSHDMNVISSHVKTVGCLNRRLFYHASREITPEMLEGVYHCPVDLIAHGVPHRVFAPHFEGEEAKS